MEPPLKTGQKLRQRVPLAAKIAIKATTKVASLTSYVPLLTGKLGQTETDGNARLIVRTQVSRLRNKIKPDPTSTRLIVTVSGLAYPLGSIHPPGRRRSEGR